MTIIYESNGSNKNYASAYWYTSIILPALSEYMLKGIGYIWQTKRITNMGDGHHENMPI